MPKRPKMRKITPNTDPKRKKLQEKSLEKSGAAVKKYLNKDSCSCMCYTIKIYISMLCLVGF